jgi:hypothetical protein
VGDEYWTVRVLATNVPSPPISSPNVPMCELVDRVIAIGCVCVSLRSDQSPQAGTETDSPSTER